MIQIHDEIARLSGQYPAGYISVNPFARLTLENLLQTIDLLKGKEIVTGAGQLSASLVGVNWDTNPEAVLANPKSAMHPDRELDLLITSSFEVVLEIFVTGDRTKVISTLVLEISDARTHVRAENNFIVLEGADFDAKRTVNRSSNADAILSSASIDPLEAARVEGHLVYGVISQAVSLSLEQRREFSLSDVFPAVDFGRTIKLAMLQGGEAIGIIPTETVTIRTQSVCECEDGPDFDVSETVITNTSPPDVGPNTEIGKVKVGGPIAEGKDPHKDFGPRVGERDGVAGLYVPKDFSEKLTIEVMPAVKFVVQDQGVIGYRADASVGFKNMRVSFDVQGGGILLDIDLDITVTAYCDFQVFKGLRLPIGWAVIAPSSGNGAHIQLGFYPSVDKNASVKLKSTIVKSDMGQYVAVVIGIGTALKLLGVTTWIGFLIDVVLSGILSHGLPITLKRELGKYMGSKEWTLIEGLQFIDPKEPRWLSAPYDVNAASLLASFDYKG